MSTLILRTTVRPEMKKWAVLKGLLLTTICLAGIWLCELILPLLGSESFAGWMAWTLRTASVGAGFFPLNKLSKQKRNPELLEINEKSITLYQQDTALFILPWEMVANFSYLDRGSSYGFAFTLKNTKTTALIQNPEDLSFLLERLESYYKQEEVPPAASPSPYKSPILPSVLLAKSRKEYGVDLFLPYFSESSFQMLKQWHAERL